MKYRDLYAAIGTVADGELVGVLDEIMHRLALLEAGGVAAELAPDIVGELLTCGKCEAVLAAVNGHEIWHHGDGSHTYMPMPPHRR